MHTTNYINTFIEVADDSPAVEGEVPPQKGADKTLASIQFELIRDHPYKYSSDDIIFGVHTVKNQQNTNTTREEFFSKGQPCLRSSPLTKRYGWGVHSDAEGKVAIYGVGSDEYKTFSADDTLKHVKGMRSKRR